MRSIKEEPTEQDYKDFYNTWKSDFSKKIDALMQKEESRAKRYDAFLDMLIEREASRAAMRRAVIEKGIIALSIYFLGLMGTLMVDGAKEHWKGMIDAIGAVRK